MSAGSQNSALYDNH